MKLKSSKLSFVSIKIYRVDKTSPLHSNLLLGKIEEVVNSYVQVVTKNGRINTLISPTRLYPRTASTQNIELAYTTVLSFSAACKFMICIFVEINKKSNV